MKNDRNGFPPEPKAVICSKCRRDCGDDPWHHQGLVWCEDCLLDLLMTPRRKTHWQYIFPSSPNS